MSGLPPSGDRADLVAVLRRRRMCRDFLAEPVDGRVLDAVLSAAFGAPSAGNTAALDLLVLQGQDATERYWRVTLPEPRRSSFPWPGLLSAPVLVVPYVEPGAYLRRYAEPDKATSALAGELDDWAVPYWFVDGGASVMAMLLAAESEALGALFFGQFDHEPAVRDEFAVPDGRRALGTIALGHPAPGGRRPSRSAARGRPDPASRIHSGDWVPGRAQP